MPEVDSVISQELNKLSQDAIKKLIAIYEKKPNKYIAKKCLDEMYKQDDTSADATFFRKHILEVLSATSNTLHIKITNKNQEIKVLSISSKISNYTLPEDVRDQLVRDGLFAKKYKATPHDCGDYNFSLTDYYAKGSFEKLYQDENKIIECGYVNELHKGCVINIKKMAEKLQKLQNNRVFFPDAKVTNWLLDDKDDVIIVDQKSLRTYEKMQTKPGAIVHSNGYWPSRMVSLQTDKDLENIHVYILGANIYDYLTCSEPPHIDLKSNQDFKKEVFEGDIGRRYKELILNLTNPHRPNSRRMGLADAIKELENIQTDMDESINFGCRPEEIASKEFRSKIIKLYPKGKNPSSHRYLINNANIYAIKLVDLNSHKNSEFKEKYQNFKGDCLKMEILADLKSRIDMVGSKEELDKLKKEIMGDNTPDSNASSAEFKVLSKHQGLIANVFIKTKSHQALEKMFADKEASLNNELSQSPD